MGWTQAGNIAGPQGPAGPVEVSADAGNTAVLGSDGLVFVSREVIVAQAGSEPADVPQGVLLVVVG